MKIIFVGIHNKPGKSPLCSSTRSGKVVDKIIAELQGLNCIKANLFDIDQIPKQEEKAKLKMDFLNNFTAGEDDIFALLGAMVHDEFPFVYQKSVKLAHPASTLYSGKKDSEYIKLAVEKIKSKLKETI